MKPAGHASKPDLVAATLAVLFLAVALTVEIAGSMPGDERVLVWLNDTFGTSMDDVMVAVGAATDTIPLIATWTVVAIALVLAGRRHRAAMFLLAVVVAMAANRLLKEIVARPRPDVRPSPESVSTFSFPSGHAANTLALALALVLVAPNRVWRRAALIVGAIVVAVVGFSRMAIGVHYPSDILAAWAWVGAWLILLSTRVWPATTTRRPKPN